jgi:hypothetical protein
MSHLTTMITMTKVIPTSSLLQPGGRLRCIGKGNCGSVWTDTSNDNDANTIKLEDCSENRSITHEFNMQNHILSTIDKRPAFTDHITVPRPVRFLTTESPEWSLLLPRLPGREKCNALINEKIRPFPLRIREALVDRYFPNLPRQSIQDDGNNQHCIIRPYLGKRRNPDQRPKRFFKMGNFPLHLDQMEELNIPPQGYAIVMAEVLAFLYWSAKVDAGDIEFVLALPRDREGANGHIFTSEFLGDHALWILDFDLCRHIEMDQKGVKEAAKCFWQDPYYPKPCPNEDSPDYGLWRVFLDRFLEASDEILKAGDRDEDQDLPRRLIEEITKGPPHRGAFAA